MFLRAVSHSAPIAVGRAEKKIKIIERESISKRSEIVLQKVSITRVVLQIVFVLSLRRESLNSNCQ